MRSAAPLLAIATLVAAAAVQAQDAPNLAVASNDGVRSFNSDEVPTFKVEDDGTVDWPTFSGYRRYSAECIVCHGPDGEGSSYAPGLLESLKAKSYDDFMLVVASGREVMRADKQSKMPALGDNRNVMCYADDIYDYLKARSDDALGRGRPAKRADKPTQATEDENACLGRS